MDSDKRIDPWMYRLPGEFFFLLLSLTILLLIGWIFSLVDFYVFVFLLVVGLVYVRLQQAQYLGNGLRIFGGQFPELFEIFKEQAKKLGLNKAGLYVVQDPYLNAHALGITSCTVVLTSALVEQLSHRELAFVIGHELGHYQAGHTKITSLINPLGSNNPFSGLIFGLWARRAEYSGDRCGLVLTKDIDSAISSLMKMSVGKELFKKVNMTGFVHQIAESKHRWVAMSELLSDHPLLVNRIQHLVNFWEKRFKINS
ncbi:hypothetical protein A2773_05765 [Candidatus Gottesmanbacteria bacterium RIFCSPHIGHO2_01_FULL_39_10]|uniref:Peptidase M48 domain-containing protein n=1 Tax=Candidatus Gottesmanbacteria bacterium RIFCSPHIGHO2_01_FULL_39_10 TaxID=1798375 RepID=A0A1F5ZPK7_9BACT|nr:MAG: hypothetical protein A2773_05765 [Candidatus Gottesmanbacteria bacterium RIFCSPHIGHO2_01_FULL_39_10]